MYFNIFIFIFNKIPYLIGKEGNYDLKKDHQYYYQVQGQLHITDRQKCFFYVYNPKWTYLQIIERDDQFWSTKMESFLTQYVYWKYVKKYSYLFINYNGLQNPINMVKMFEFKNKMINYVLDFMKNVYSGKLQIHNIVSDY